MSRSDFAIIERAQQGEAAAFDYLVLRYQHDLLQLIMRYVRDPAEAEDIAQEAFLKAYRALGSFRESTFYTWLCRIAIKIAKSTPASRRERRTPEPLVLTDEIRDTVHSAIERLPREFRRAILLREVEGMTYEQIAATMNCPPRTVRSYIFLARAVIDGRLQQIFEGGPA